MKKVYGKTPTGGREEHDYYATDPIAVKLLLNQEKFDCNIWECASGENHIANVLKEYGYNVRTSDIVKRTPTTEVKDFLKSRKKWDGDIITNPPFKYAQEFIDKALSLVGEGHKVAMFLRLQFLEGITRYESLFKDNPPKTVYVASRRIKCGKDGDFNSSMSSIMCLAWFVWEKGFKGDTIIKWINHDEELDEKKMKVESKTNNSDMYSKRDKTSRGGKKRLFDIVVSGQDRAEHDFYATPPEAVKCLLNVEKFDTNIWECASGQNHIADVLKEYDYNVRTSDIVKRTPTTEQMDFLSCKEKEWKGAIVSNPPFTLAKEFVEKSLSLIGNGQKVAMFLRLQFLDGLKRYELFKNYPPKRVYIFSRRVRCGKDGDFTQYKSGGIQSNAWFVWEKGYQGKPEIDWINHDEELDENKMRATPKENKKAENKIISAKIICFWNQSATDATYLVRSLCSLGAKRDRRAIEIGIAEDRVASIIPTMNQSASINGLQAALCQALIVPIPAVGWTVGMYEMPQCTARGTPLCLKESEVFKFCFKF